MPVTNSRGRTPPARPASRAPSAAAEMHAQWEAWNASEERLPTYLSRAAFLALKRKRADLIHLAGLIGPGHPSLERTRRDLAAALGELLAETIADIVLQCMEELRG